MIKIAEKNVFEKLKNLSKKKILEYKLICEANVVSILYKNPEFFEELELTLDDFNINCWKVYFETARSIYVNENKKVLDDMTVGLYLEKHKKLKEKFIEYGGYETIVEAGKYVKSKNFDGYVEELLKWKTVLRLNDLGFPIYDRLSDFADMNIDEIYDGYEGLLNDTFMDVSNECNTYDISDGIFNLIDKLDEGVAMGLPYHNLPILTQETSGQALGNITLVGGLSNVGKSTFVRNATIPMIIEKNEKIVIMLNEESLTKWQRELFVYVANNILKKELKKKTVRNGRFDVDKRAVLKESAQWIVDNTKNHMITIVTFKHFKTSFALKQIRKFCSLGVKYFALDTFKMDSGRTSDKEWVALQQNMVEINDLVKEENKNVHITITFQLSKSSTRQRFYMQDNIGMAKNIVDPVSTCLMIRKVFTDEYPGEKKELDIRDKDGKKIFLESNKNYQIIFIIKNREGRANEYQIVVEHDLSKNILKEVGIVNVPLDF